MTASILQNAQDDKPPSRLRWFVAGVVACAVLVSLLVSFVGDTSVATPCWDGVAKSDPNGKSHHIGSGEDYCPHPSGTYQRLLSSMDLT